MRTWRTGWFAPHNTSQATYTGADWQKLEVVYDDRNLYDSISVEYSGRKIEPETMLWEPDDPRTDWGESKTTITANFSYPAYTVPQITWQGAYCGWGGHVCLCDRDAHMVCAAGDVDDCQFAPVLRH